MLLLWEMWIFVCQGILVVLWGKMPISLDVLKSIPKSCARLSMRWQASWSWECVGVAISISSM